ncbi:hypothetical protein BDW68DRAFT_156461 [Aspergillus falconensis]
MAYCYGEGRSEHCRYPRPTPSAGPGHLEATQHLGNGILLPSRPGLPSQRWLPKVAALRSHYLLVAQWCWVRHHYDLERPPNESKHTFHGSILKHPSYFQNLSRITQQYFFVLRSKCFIGMDWQSTNTYRVPSPQRSGRVEGPIETSKCYRSPAMRCARRNHKDNNSSSGLT